MFGNKSHLKQTQKYVTAFATLFNDISINPHVPSDSGLPSKEMTVPIAFGAREKWLTIMRQDPDKTSQAVALPRMGFEIVGFAYDPEKTLQTTIKRNRIGSRRYHSPANYRLDMSLYIMAKYHEDVFAIMEQIIPYFRPKITVKIRTLDDLEKTSSMAVELLSVSPEVEYEGAFDDRRTIIYSMTFSVLVPYWIGQDSTGTDGPIIKKAIGRLHSFEGEPESMVTLYPGMTEAGEPTNDPNQSIPYQEIEADDNYDIIIEYGDFND